MEVLILDHSSHPARPDIDLLDHPADPLELLILLANIPALNLGISTADLVQVRESVSSPRQASLEAQEPVRNVRWKGWSAMPSLALEGHELAAVEPELVVPVGLQSDGQGDGRPGLVEDGCVGPGARFDLAVRSNAWLPSGLRHQDRGRELY